MELGFIQTAAPAGPVAPVTAAGPSAGASNDAGAFDAALAQTLADKPAAAAKSGGEPAPAAHPHWLLAEYFSDTTTAVEAEAGEETVAGDPFAADEDGLDEQQVETAPEAAMQQAPVPVPVPAAPTQAEPVRIAITANGNNPANAPALTANATADGDCASLGAGLAAVGPNGETAAAADGALAESAEGIAAAADMTERAGAPAGRSTASFRPANAAAIDVADVAEPVRAQADGAASAAATPSPTGATADAAAALSAGAASGAAATQGVPRGESAQQIADAAGLAGVSALPFTGGQDASMNEGGQQGGQNRPSQEFVRFAAALANVAEGTDKGAAPAAVTPASLAAQPSASTAAAHVAAAPGTTAGTETPAAENVGRLVQAMRVISRPGAWEANVRLNPEHLGDVSIAVRVERNTVSAVVNAESAGVRQWLESQEEAVRNGMAEHGLQLDRFVVQRDGQRRETPDQEQQQGRRGSRGRQAASTQRFEIVV